LLINLPIHSIPTISKVDLEGKEDHKGNTGKDMMAMEGTENGTKIVKRGSRGNMWTWIIQITKLTRLSRIQRGR
jgi:hypothetical protein